MGPDKEKRVLLLGHPIAHSLSPTFQNAAFRALKLPLRYELYPIRDFVPDEVRALLALPEVVGANVTVPHKRGAMSVAEELTPLAEQVGAVNTLYRDPAEPLRIIGDNTDVSGLHLDLARLIGAERVPTALVLGAGGAARGTVLALARRCSEIIVINRTLAKAQQMLRDLAPHIPAVTATCAPWPTQPQRHEWIDRVGIVVDATSMNASPVDSRRTLALLELENTADDTLFYDLKYGVGTALGEIAREMNRRFVDGLGMLVFQGAEAFRHWTGRAAPTEVMFAAAREGQISAGCSSSDSTSVS